MSALENVVQVLYQVRPNLGKVRIEGRLKGERSRRRQAEIDGVDANQIYESIDIGEEIAFECQRSVRDIELMLAKMDLANVLEVYNGRLTRKQSDFLRLYLSGLGVTDISKINGTTVAAPCRMLHYLAKQLRRRSRARPAVKQP